MEDKFKNSPWGCKVGVLTPATNLTVEEELWSMRVPSATVSTARIVIDVVDWTKPDGLQKFVEGVNARLPETATRVMQVQPDTLMLGISSSNLWGGLKGNEQIKRKMYEQTKIEMITPVDAMVEASKVLQFKNIGVVTPYPAVADAKIVEFFSEFGVNVIAQKSLHITSPGAIGDVTEATLCEAMRTVNVKGVDAIIQLGTDLRMAVIAAEAINWLGVHALSVNTTTWWHCLRKNKIKDNLKGWGTLMADH